MCSYVTVVVGNSTEIVKLLLLRGADPNATDKMNAKSCLMAATLLGKHEMVHQLLLGKADPTYVNANEKSILDVSTMVGSEVQFWITGSYPTFVHLCMHNFTGCP